MSAYHLPILAIKDIPRLALDVMNQTHQDEVQLVNQLGEQVLQGMDSSPDIKVITQLLDDWLEHTRQHFANENRLMQEYGFPMFPVHSAEHERVLTLIEQVQSQWHEQSSLEALADFIFHQWPQWFDQHVNTMDMVTAQFIKQSMAR